MSRNEDITVLLRQWQQGDTEALNVLMPLIYDELCRIARSHLNAERHSPMFRTRVLVHEAYLRLCPQRGQHFEGRSHFFGIVSRIMRQILVDHARGNAAEKRGGLLERIHIEDIDGLGPEENLNLQKLNLALNALEVYDKRLCEIVELRYFCGLTIEEAALALNTSPATLKREWTFAKAWLLRNMSMG